MELLNTSFPLGSQEEQQAQKIVEILNRGKLTTYDIASALKSDAQSLLPHLIDLELNGVIECSKGKEWCLRGELSC